MKHKRYPQIRFKGFNDDWEQRKFGNYGSVSMCKRVFKNETSDNGDIPFYKIGTFGEQADAFISNEKYEYYKSKFSYPNKGDILLSASGTIGRIVEYTGEKAYFQDSNIVWLNHNDNIKNSFLKVLYPTVKWDGIEGSTIKRLYNSNFLNTDINVPKIIEQEKIGLFFNNIDNLITLHQNKHDKLTEIKNSLLEKMFPKNNEKIPEIRFKGFHNDWRQYKLDDFGKSTGGVSIESEFTNDGEYKVISIGSYSEMSTYNDQGIRCKLSNRTKDKVLNKDDITMILNDKTSSGNIIGRVLLIDKSGDYVYNQRTERIEINKKEYDPMFIYQLLNAPNIRKKIINESQGNTQIYVNWTKIKELLYYVPDIKEQEKLGIYFKNIDNLIILHQNKLKKLKKLKETLLRKMFI